ncbi:hypothetical protein QYE76_012375 [Lolium multiflorum]|uniref:chitinase n=1 Tax=Lolium multiflorum TaxID=4521 RepID=A0AAD8U0J6_LOLMU|nr:hypothetical protein QYE76_012375 [Lolium multiflorum]
MARFGALAVCAAALVLAVAVGGAAAQGVGSVITQAVYDSMLPKRGDPLCDSGFFTYDAFIAAAAAFPSIGTTGSADDVKRELAAFFGQTSHETTGGTRGAPDQFEWGYCFKQERDPDPALLPYQGRGPIQLTGQSNYQLAGDAIQEDLVGNPDRVSQDPVISFKTAMWFWTTAQGNKPSCQDVALRRWTPTAADTAAGRVPGYGVITNIINGGLECGSGPNVDRNADRIGYYTRYCSILGTDPGGNLDCRTQQNFAQA